MLLLESFGLALALSVDSLVVSTTSAFKSRMPFRKGLLMATVFALCQGLFPLLGALLGEVCRTFVAAIDHWIAFGLLCLVGGKMIWDAFHETEADDTLDVTRFRTMCLLGVATSIDAFVVGVGFGLDSTLAETLVTVLVILVVTWVASLVGVILGKHSIPIPEKAATVVAGLVLIGLGTYTLLEHLVL